MGTKPKAGEVITNNFSNMKTIKTLKGQITRRLKAGNAYVEELKALRTKPGNVGKYDFEIWYLGEKGITKRLRDAEADVFRLKQFRIRLNSGLLNEEGLDRLEAYLY